MVKKNKPLYTKVAVVYNADKERAREEWTRVQRWLKGRNTSVIGGPRVTPKMKHADFVVALGGGWDRSPGGT